MRQFHCCCGCIRIDFYFQANQTFHHFCLRDFFFNLSISSRCSSINSFNSAISFLTMTCVLFGLLINLVVYRSCFQPIHSISTIFIKSTSFENLTNSKVFNIKTESHQDAIKVDYPVGASGLFVRFLECDFVSKTYRLYFKTV